MKSKHPEICKTFILIFFLTLQLSSAIPISKERTSKQQSCRSWLASKVDKRIVPAQIADSYRLFALRDSTTLKQLQDVDSLLKNGRVCDGLGDASNLQVVFDSIQETKSQEAMLIIAPDSYQHGTATLLKVSCDQRVLCLNITFTETIHTSRRLQIRAASHMTSEGGSHDSGERVQAITGGAIVTVIGLLILISVVALCGGSNTYETSNNTTGIDKRADNEVAVSVTVSVTPAIQPTTNQVEATTKEQNGNVSHPQPPTEPTELKRHSLGSPSRDPTASAAASTEEQAQRARTLSARSFDPLPELPKLDLAEKLPDKEEDDEEEAPYSYARVPKGDDVPHSDSSDEDEIDSPNRDLIPPAVPPYGKVTASDKGKQAPLDNMMGEYAEVTGEGRRYRSVTAPVDPSEVDGVRNRAFTESAAHLPLPAIPKGPRPALEEDNVMYDSIPETMAEAQAKTARIKKERLYESVDEMANDAEDMYESVPEELKPDSPLVVSPIVLTPSSPERPPLPTSPRHPESPTVPPPNPHSGLELKVDESSKKKKSDKKALEKTLSSSDQAEKKRTFSIFNRKKAISVSEGVAKTKKKPEKELQSPKPHQGEPLPDIPLQLSPATLPLTHPKTPLPAPPNDDEEEDMYDKPEISLPKSSDLETTTANVRTTLDAKARSKTLPATGRSSGLNSFKFNQNLPLPDLPEDYSGQGLVTVTHPRHLEDSSKVTEPYDIVHISPPPSDEPEEPNYDTVRPDLILHVDPSLEVRGNPDPGYDRVGIKLDGDTEESNALSDEDRGSERNTSPGWAGEIIVREIPSPELDDSVAGPIPDHDEVGYARVPEMHRMRKRAMSANQGAMKKPNSQRKMSTDDTDIQKRATSPDEVYAIIDMAAKKRNRQKKPEDLDVTERDTENSSPVPPPLPPMGDMGDLSEFDQPPLPERLDEANHLMVQVENDSGYSKVLKVGPTLGADPPYAKVKSKVEHPYAELDIGGSAKPDLTNGSNPSSPIELEASGYDTITIPATKESTDAKSAADDENHMYDTLTPPMGPTEVTVVIGTPEENLPLNSYDTMTATNAESDLEAEGPYEEIDEETRHNLQKLHPKPV